MRDLRARTVKTVCFIAALFSILLSASPALAQTVTAMWDPSPPADQVTGYQVCIGTTSLSCNVGLVTKSPSATSHTFTPTGGVRHYVAIRATNAAGASPYSSEVNFSIPSFTQPVNQSTVAGTAVTLNLSITDPDGSPLTITHTGLPVGLSINSANKRITGTPAAAGTYNVTLFVNDGLVTVSRSFVWTVTAAPVAELIWRHRVSGDNVVWFLNQTTVIGMTWLPKVADTNWELVASSDINGDGASDLIWRHRVSGDNVVWFLNQTTVIGMAWLPKVADTNWELVASSDINRDGASDLIWRHRVSGDNVVWFLNQTTVIGMAWLPKVADTNWELVASSDINRDGASDLIWRHRVSGDNVVWFLNQTTVIGMAWLPKVADTNWELVASSDINRDGASDLIWRHRVSGDNVVWFLNQTTVIGMAWLPTVSDGDWRMIGAR